MKPTAVSTAAHAGGSAGQPQRGSFRERMRRARRFLATNPLILIGLIMTVFMLAVAIVGPEVAPYDPTRINNLNRLKAPNAEHWLGTDEFGRDVLSRLLYGARVSALIGFTTLVLTTVFGTVVGLVSGYFRPLDAILMRVMDGLMTFPSLILAIALIAVLGINAFNVVIALTIVYTPQTARVVRSSVLSVKATDFIEATRALGNRHVRIMFRHVLPNCVSPLIVQSTFIMGYAILAEAALSFIGAGVPPPAPSWGNMLADSRVYMYQAPWMTYFPGIGISIFVLGLILLGDGVRDYLDPRN
ncbi:MAG: ABC transporter permease [Trueperaceae bacterium]